VRAAKVRRVEKRRADAFSFTKNASMSTEESLTETWGESAETRLDVVVKLSDWVVPVTYALPALSTAMPKPCERPRPKSAE